MALATPLPGILQFITSLVDASNAPVSADALSSLRDKVVLLYFSAAWCPPCRQFAPLLAKYAESHKDELVVVYVSNDHDARQFNGNLKKPFLAVPYDDLKTRQILSTALEIASIPTLAVAEPGTGMICSFQGREEVFYHVTRKTEDPIKAWVGKGAAGNIAEQEEEMKKREAEEKASGCLNRHGAKEHGNGRQTRKIRWTRIVRVVGSGALFTIPNIAHGTRTTLERGTGSNSGPRWFPLTGLANDSLPFLFLSILLSNFNAFNLI